MTKSFERKLKDLWQFLRFLVIFHVGLRRTQWFLVLMFKPANFLHSIASEERPAQIEHLTEADCEVGSVGC